MAVVGPDDCEVEQLATQGADAALGECVRDRRSSWGLEDLDAFGSGGVDELAVAVTHECSASTNLLAWRSEPTHLDGPGTQGVQFSVPRTLRNAPRDKLENEPQTGSLTISRRIVSISLERPVRTERQANNASGNIRFTQVSIGGRLTWSAPTSEFRHTRGHSQRISRVTRATQTNPSPRTRKRCPPIPSEYKVFDTTIAQRNRPKPPNESTKLLTPVQA